MCSFQTWFHDDQTGYVVECKECQNLQIGFGNVQATICATEFDSLRKYIAIMIENHIPRDNKQVKTIVLKTPYEGFSILLSELELKDLYCMIEQADNERKAAQLMMLFHASE